MPGMQLPPGEPMIMRPFGPSTNVGVDEDSGRFFGAIALASRADELEAVRHARLHREIVHLVVQQDAGARHHQARAEEEIERQGRRDHVAASRRSRRSAWLRGRPAPHRRPATRRWAWPCPCGWKRVARRRSSSLMSRATGTSTKSGSPRYTARSRCTRRMASTMRCVRVTLSTLSRSKPSRMFKRVDQRDASRRRRRARHDARAAIVADHRRTLDDLVVSQVRFGPVAAELAHAGDELLRECALVVTVGALARQQLEAGREIRLLDDVADRRHFAVVQEHARGVRRLEERVLLEGHAAAHARRTRETRRARA